MATIDSYVVDIKVKGEQDLKNTAASSEQLGKSLKGLNENFEMAKGKAEQFAVAIAGIGMAEYIHSTLEAAAQTKDLSEAYGLTIASVLELQAGFAKAGKNADDMSKIFTTLSVKANEVADGNTGVESSFNELGITFNDLKTLSMDQVIIKIGKAMEEGHGSAKTLAAAMDVLGKGAKGLPWGDFVQGAEGARGKMDDVAIATEKLDETMKKLEASSAAIRREFTALLGPVAEVFNSFMEGTDNAKAAAYGLAAAMTVIAGALAIKGVTAIAEAYKGLAVMLGLTTVETVAETAALSTNTAAQAANASIRTAGLAAKVASLQASIANSRAILAEAAAEEASVLATAQLAGARRVLMIQTSQLAAAEAMLAEAAVVSTVAIGEAAVATTVLGTATGFLMSKLGPIIIALTAVATAYEMWSMYSDKNKAAEKADEIAAANEKVREGNQGLLGDEAKKLDLQAAATAGLRSSYEAQALLLTQSQKRLQLQLDLIGAGEIEKTQKLASYDQQAKKQQEILKLQQDIEKMEITAANDKEGAAKYASQLTVMKAQLEILSTQTNKTAELTTQIKKAEEAQQIRKFYLDAENKSTDEQIKLQFELAGLTRTADEQRIASIQERIQLEARAEIVRREALMGNGGKLPEAEQLEIVEKLTAAYAPLVTATQQVIDQSRDFNTGWTKAFNQYADDASNAAKRAGDLFNAVTSNMNSAIDNFVETGKFKFGDFASSLIKDMLKIELKASAMNLMKMMGGSGGAGGGGLLSSIGGMLGFAEGGDPPVDKPSIVGEKGPELFVPKTAGTIIPNGGGMPAGGGGTSNTYITNNINAVDAKSVAQLFAENRKALLGSVKMAEKEMPYKMR